MTTEKLPPHDISAEESVLGALLLDGRMTQQVAAVLTPEDFYRERNAWVYEACLGLMEQGEAVDQVTVAHRVSAKDRLVGIGGSAYLSHLVSTTPSSVHAVHYAGIVHDTADQRRCITLARDLTERAFGNESPVQLAEFLVSNGLGILKARQERGGLQLVKDVAGELFFDIWEDFNSGFKSRGVQTGIGYLDHMLGGLEAGKLYVVGARTSVGKTMFLLTIARNIAGKGVPVAYFSTEQTQKSMLTRMITQQLGMDVRQMSAEARQGQETPFIDAYGRIGDLPFWFTDGRSMTTADIHSSALAISARNPLGLVVVDFLGQLRDRPWTTNENQVHLLGRMTDALKYTAMELGIPVVVAVQLNRGPEDRASKRAELRDLRDSGEIEQTADVVILLYRESYYDKTKGNTLEINVAKNRDGPTGRNDIFYDPATGKMGDLVRESYEKTGNPYMDGVN